MSLVIATYNRAEQLMVTLGSVAMQNAEAESWECIVVDNNSSDNTRERVEAFKSEHNSLNIRYIFEQNQGLSYARNAGPELKHELDITAADMRSGNNEVAITRLEARVGSPLMSDVCRGLISIDRGDVNTVYWKSLSMKFADIQRQQLKLEAEKIPKKVKKLSMCLLFCFMLIYVVVILAQIISSVGVLFG